MPYTTTFKRILNVFAPGNLDRTRCTSISHFQDLSDGEQEKDNLEAYSDQASQVISATQVEEHYSYLKHHDMTESSLSNFEHTGGDTDSELYDYDSEDEQEDEASFAVTNTIVFSEDPITCSNEMIEFANDLVEIAVTNIIESEDIMDAPQVEDLSRWKERLDQISGIVETDTPTVRLLKARTYLAAASDLLKRVIFVVELAKSLNEIADAARPLTNTNSESTTSHCTI